MTEKINYDVANEMATSDAASIITSTSSEYDPVKEIALQLGVEYVDYPDFEDVATIKTGKNLLIKRAIWKEQSRRVALKYIFGVDTEEQHKKLENEIMRALQNLDDDNLLQLYGVSQDLESTNCMLVLQYADSGNLREFLDQKEQPWINKLRIARDIAYGLRHLHKAGVVHGDLHTQNIFIDKYRAFIRAPRMISPDDTSLTYYKSAPETIPYVDPKIVNDETSLPDRHSDIYGLGVILWEILSNQLPFKGQTRLTVEEMLKISREQTTHIVPEEYIKLLQDCWNDDPEKRPTIEQVCKQLKDLLRNNPDSQRKETQMDESGEEDFTFDESIPYQSREIKENGHTNSQPYQSRDIQENGHINSQPSLPPESNDLDIPRRSTQSAVNQRHKRYSKMYQTLKFNFQQTKTTVFNAFSKMSCLRSKTTDT
ncbi:kinase-like domain-containing protein [Gigaspora rosea]|uniref:Kinase-like domain-containing protein n=1 Tax=Gigaspora rosea TaxID=44941 RepID=A0A397VA46_9GLOM|nr:kinase-like domain-containing protein [Gigaspora rosea]